MPGKVHVPVTVATDGFEKLQRTFSRLKGVAIGLTAAIAGLGAVAKAIDFSGAAIQGARDLERNYAGLTSVFKENTDQMKEFGKTASEMGLSMNEAAKATTFIGSVLKQSGFSIQETADLTEELVELGADLALTYGYDVQEALLGMTALFRGEYDPIEKFGVAMKQSEIDAEKAARGLDGLTGAAERFADQQIRVEFLMERASDAMGAFDRQSGNLTVQQMRLRAEFENVRDTVADDLLPPLADFTGGLREIVEDVGPDLDKFFNELAPVLDDLAKDALPILKGGIELVIDAFSGMIEIVEMAQDPTTNLGGSLEELGNSLDRLFNEVTDQGPGATTTIESFADSLATLADAITVVSDTLDEYGDEILTFLGIVVAGRLGKGATGALGRKNKNVETLEGIATNIGLIGAAIYALPKGVLAMGLVGFLLGHQTYKDLDLGDDVNDLRLSFEHATESAEDFDRAVSNANYVRINPFGALSNGTERTADNFKILGDDVKTVGDMFGFVKDEQTPLISSFEGFRDITYQTADAQAELRRRTAEAYVEQLNFNAAIAQFKLLASTAVDTSTLEGVLQASAGRGMGGGVVGWDAEAYLKGIGLITPDGKEEEVSGTIQDYVGDFFGQIDEEIKKQAARLDLQELGLSEALIDQIVGSQGWEEVFDAIISGGAEMARQLQDDFNQTAAGIDELAKAAEEAAKQLEDLRQQQADLQAQIRRTQAEQKEAIEGATIAFNKYKEGIDNTVNALETYERAIGRFESQTRSDLQRIESQVMDAFDNGYLLEEARDNLLEYARAELNVLMQIQRQRDDLLGQRNAAADAIFGIAQAVSSAGNITSLLRDVQDEVKEVQVTELFEDVVKSADGLKDFKVTVERNYTDVITNTVSKSQALVNGFQDVVDRTRAFIDNLLTLRELGLDPFLFQQLVEAGAEAGGATAAALVEGGADTVNEVNELQAQLEAMGVELGEATYEVTQNSGEQFVSGIIDGLDSQLEALEEQATITAETFTETFSAMMEQGLTEAFGVITSTLEREFNTLIATMQAELARLLALIEELEQEQNNSNNGVTQRQIDIAAFAIGKTQASIGLPGDDTGIIEYISPSNIPEGLILPPDMAAAFGQQYGAQSNTTNYFVTANNPLDAHNAANGNVLQQATFQSANGNIQTTLSGVGN